MANRLHNQAVFTGPTNDPENTNVASLDYPGQLGAIIRVGDKTYQLVQVASTATAPAPADGITAYWKDKSAYIVGDLGDAEADRNGPAGVYNNAITAAQYGFIQIGGGHTNVLTAGAPAVGDTAVANTGTAGDVTPTLEGTAPTSKPIGVYLSTATSSRATVEIELDGS